MVLSRSIYVICTSSSGPTQVTPPGKPSALRLSCDVHAVAVLITMNRSGLGSNAAMGPATMLHCISCSMLYSMVAGYVRSHSIPFAHCLRCAYALDVEAL